MDNKKFKMKSTKLDNIAIELDKYMITNSDFDWVTQLFEIRYFLETELED